MEIGVEKGRKLERAFLMKHRNKKQGFGLLWKQENPRVGTISIVSKVVSGGMIEGKVIGKLENVVLGKNKRLVKRRSTTRD
jgi:hypothetical protein